MEYNGKLFGALVGVLLGAIYKSPPGMLLGFLVFSYIGHVLYDLPMTRRRFDDSAARYNRRRGEYIYYLFSLCAKMAKADGKVSDQEIKYMEILMRSHLRLTDKARAEAIKVWSNAKESSRPFSDFAMAFYDAFRRERARVLDMMDLLFAVAAADGGGRLHPAKEKLLQQAAAIFQINRMQYERIKARYFHVPQDIPRSVSSLDPHYAILGAQPYETLDAIKKKYKNLALQWHPDAVASRGASLEAQRHAKEKFQQINEAFERISEARGAR